MKSRKVRIQKLKPFSNKIIMEKTNAEKFKLGIFVIRGWVLFVTAVYFIGNKKNMFGL